MRLAWAQVLEVLEQDSALQRLRVHCLAKHAGEVAAREVVALNYLALNAAQVPDARVLVNTTGLDLGLGTGGVAFVVPSTALDIPVGTPVATGTPVSVDAPVPVDAPVLADAPVPAGAPVSVAASAATNASISTDTACLPQDSLVVPTQIGHIIKLRYTPLQREYATVEEPGSPYHAALKDATSLDALPVVCCELHSQMPLVAAAVKHRLPSARLVYVMTDQAALPLAFSRLCKQTREAGLIDRTITSGQAFGGELEAINLHSALLAARHVALASVAIVAPGPGIVGSHTRLGHGGVAQGEAINAVAALGGRSVAVLRLSWADARPRHQALSHHSIVALGQVSLAGARVAVPKSLSQERKAQLDAAIAAASLRMRHSFHDIEVEAITTNLSTSLRGLEVMTMGRTYTDDPEFFEAAFAAGILAADLTASFDG
ncbi:MAG: DUF3866 family protein [Coriobacteriales bacterium]|jgi:hypothetical protein|nr:DUF3866 family protein [Coriobacteriales bacterium]